MVIKESPDAKDIKHLCNTLNDEFLMGEEIGACIAAYTYDELSYNEIIQFSEDGKIGTNRWDETSVGPLSYYSYDSLLLAKDKACELLQDKITNEQIKNTSVKKLSKFADEDWFGYVINKRFDEDCDSLWCEDDSIFENRFIHICYNLSLIDDDDFITDEYGDADYKFCTKPEQELFDAYKENWNETEVFNSVEYFIDNYGEGEFKQEIIDNPNSAFSMEDYCWDMITQDNKIIAQTLATYDGIQRVVSNGDTEFYVYRIN